ncbi:gamma-glutamyl-gamma-aminobutyrate hydrolase family protein [Ruminococcaceae bacterium OttesenSCG-928-N02]|nr:gamma-glutamyl-gamma-aminobutyrate hydrolase family protein [Ruminococcaceae bacterium OttesenSCG-928-N02]
MKKPVILMSSTQTHTPNGTPYYTQTAAYFHAIEKHGGLPVLSTFTFTEDEENLQAVLEQVDGVFLTGGEDVNPAAYGEEKLPSCGGILPARDEMELKLLRAALDMGKPILCVCRGLQILNVLLGGTLYQDIPTQAPSDILHPAFEKLWEVCHTVQITDENSYLYAAVGAREIGVNSSHHQSIKDLAPGLKVTATAPDGIIEAVELDPPGKNYLCAVQWHPERMFNEPQYNQIFGAFMQACKG